VWRAISDPKEFGAWFGVDLENTEFVPGTEARGRVTNEGYEHIVWRARVDRVEPPHLLAFRWHPHGIDAAVDYEQEPTTLVQFELREVEGGTLLTLVESGFDKLPESRRASAYRGNEDGWAQQMVRVERYVAGNP
jgi:uncharacterized protein YndB with AHSA1/START domain